MLLLLAVSRYTLGQEVPYAHAVLKDRPIAYLQFDATVDTNDNQPFRDATGMHQFHVTGNLQYSNGMPGIGGLAAVFDGLTTVVTVPDDNIKTLDSLSVEFWFRSHQAFNDTFWPGSATLISKATPGAGTSDWTINAASTKNGEDQGRLLAESGPAATPQDLYLYSPINQPLNDDRWHHFVWTRAASGSNRMYVDGVLASQGHDGGGRVSNDRSIQIGGDTMHEGARHFKGLIDEVAIYNKPLPLERVRAHYLAATVQRRLPATANHAVDFVRDIQPIFRRRCFECHGPGHSEGGLSLAAAMEGATAATLLNGDPVSPACWCILWRDWMKTG